MNGAGRIDADNNSKFFTVRKFHRFAKIYRIKSGVFQCSGGCQDPPAELGAAFHIRYRIYFIFRILTCGIKTGCRQFFSFTCRIDIGKISILLAIAQLAYPAAQITLINLIIVIGIINPGIQDIMYSNVRIIVGYIEISLIPEFASPAVGADKRPVTFQVQIEIFFRVIIIPSDNHYVVIGFGCSDIAVSALFLIIIARVTLACHHGSIEGALHSSVKIYRPLDCLIIFAWYNLNLLNMPDRLKSGRGILIAVYVVLFINRTLPCKKIGHGHRIFAAVILFHMKTVPDGHMIFGKA